MMFFIPAVVDVTDNSSHLSTKIIERIGVRRTDVTCKLGISIRNQL